MELDPCSQEPASGHHFMQTDFIIILPSTITYISHNFLFKFFYEFPVANFHIHIQQQVKL